MDPVANIFVEIDRAALVSRGACKDGLDLFDAIAPSGYLLTRWTIVHQLWLAGAYPSHSRWLEDEGLIPRLSLIGANLDGANLDGANLYGANLDGANLYGANLVRANLDGASLDGANLCGANLDGASRRTTDPAVPGWIYVNGALRRDT